MKNNKPVILVGSQSGEIYDGNGRAMYEYLVKEHSREYSVYWCTESKRLQNKLNRAKIKTVVLGSMKNYWLFYGASVVFFTHSCSTDVAPLTDRINLMNPLKVHLSHGIEALKGRNLEDKIIAADFYVCSSEFEKAIKQKEWNISKNKLIVTGVPRYDLFEPSAFRDQSRPIKEFLYLPTWRDWDTIKNKSDFEKTQLFMEICKICTNVRLNNFLSSINGTMTIHLHPFISQYSGALEMLTGKNFIISKEPISKEIVKADALITDYSSVSLDFLYLKKPVIFFQFDQRTFLKKRGAYIDYKKDLFGSVAFDVDTVLNCMEQVVNGRSTFENLRETRKFFKYRDNHNCERVWKHVSSTL